MNESIIASCSHSAIVTTIKQLPFGKYWVISYHFTDSGDVVRSERIAQTFRDLLI